MGNSIDSGYTATATFTPAAAAYLANDVMDVAKALTFLDRDGKPYGGGQLMIVSTELQIAHTAVIAGETSYTLQTYNATPPSAHADNDAWDVPAGDRAARVGCGPLSLGTPVDVGSTLEVYQDQVNKVVTVPANGTIYGELVTAGAFTPTAAARKVTLHAVAL